MPNALVGEKSPYLRQHADNPVDWLPWGKGAFERAHREGKPIFLSIGYATCHWCHVMARECFEDLAIAERLNADFIPIKVDREERPDVDKVYMAYVQAFSGHGGWPLNVWLTPELKPFFGGTYFPPEDKAGRPGFAKVLKAVAEAWDEKRESLEQDAGEALEKLRAHQGNVSEDGVGGETLVDEAAEAFEVCFQYLHENHDEAHGGFGGAPKFPRMANLNFLLRCAAVQGADSDLGREALRLTTNTLRAMAAGGIRDHVGGGFHRYSVDAEWFVPHFEKMLYDQAQIVMALIDAHHATGDERLAWVAKDVLDYTLRDLASPGGGFCSAEDADSALSFDGEEHAEGAFYTWAWDELREAIGDKLPVLADHFGLKPEGNVPAESDPQGELRGRNLLRQVEELAQTAEANSLGLQAASDLLTRALEQLQAVRQSRPRPLLDNKIITAWNGLMLSALARAATSTAACLAGQRETYRAAAVATAKFVQRELADESGGRLYRSYLGGRGGTGGFAEDYACLIAGLLDLYEVTFDVGWLQWAERLQVAMDSRFYDDEAGGYFNSAAGDPHIVLRLKESYDGAEPAPGSLAVANLLRLAVIAPERSFGEKARRTLLSMRSIWKQTPQAIPEMLCAMERWLTSPRQIVIAGDPASAGFQALVAVCRQEPGPRFSLLAADGAEGQAWLATRRPEIAGMVPKEDRATAYLCADWVCQAPTTSQEELRELCRALR